MNISNLKLELSNKIGKSIPTLAMVRQLSQDEIPVPTEWLSHWDNDKRVRIAMHQDVFNILKVNQTLDTLAYKTSLKPKTDTAEAYTIFTVIIPAHIEGTF